MKIISHRGNINGPSFKTENSEEQILDAIEQGYDVEVDVRMFDGQIHLGHDEPSYKSSIEWLSKYKKYLWIHCKDLESLELFSTKFLNYFNFFWHQEDSYTLTSFGYVWVYPGRPCPSGSIIVIKDTPVLNVLKDQSIFGVCTDYPILISQNLGKE